ncbi:dienelactone hydrolase family protein [Sphingomonas sp. BIUV-7]|uniref:Dienelactone hydrolase family protein n=1 Tax=Sphingomonas natans TaxID=3063330 RepID=A0ABT8YCE7_9SPHN|nr:dienelactone hydrolase family protein [Sphingomonas sp. BIUV-7]MDO6416005.1 dienelactone hydrolase family protein [Sphingomonas sp. BIUV-7]
MAETIQVAALDGSGSFDVYCATPAAKPTAAIIVIQEIFGVNAGIRQKADDWAALGYLALAPDMFWRFAPGLDLNPDIPEQMAEGFEIRTKFDIDKGIEDVEAVIRAARALLTGGKIGIVGFCLGGRVCFLTATRTDIDASVGFYGAGIDGMLGESHAIARPLLLHFAEQDHFIDADARAKIHAALDGNAHVTIEEYAGVDHGFADTFGKRRSDEAASLAEARTREFFAAHLA